MTTARAYKSLIAVGLALAGIAAMLAAGPALAQATAPKDFRDDFAGTSLRPEWTIQNPDANRWALVDNEVLLLILKNTKNQVVYSGPIPDRCEMLVKISIPTPLAFDYFWPATGFSFDHSFEIFRIGLIGEKDYQLQLNMSSQSKDYFTIEKTIDKDKAVLFNTSERGSGSSTDIYLKMRRSGIEYSGFASYDGKTWIDVGKHFFPGFQPTSFYLGGFANTNTEKAVKVDFVEIKSLK